MRVCHDRVECLLCVITSREYREIESTPAEVASFPQFERLRYCNGSRRAGCNILAVEPKLSSPRALRRFGERFLDPVLCFFSQTYNFPALGHLHGYSNTNSFAKMLTVVDCSIEGFIRDRNICHRRLSTVWRIGGGVPDCPASVKGVSRPYFFAIDGDNLRHEAHGAFLMCLTPVTASRGPGLTRVNVLHNHG